MKKKTIQDYKAEIRQLQVELDLVRRTRNRHQILAGQHRRYLRDKFEWFIDLLAENKTPHLPWLIKNMTQHFASTGDLQFNELPRAF